MARLPTITLKDPKTGEQRIVNRSEYNRRLSKYAGWKVISESNVGVTEAAVREEIAELDAEIKRFQKPGHISRGDEQRKYEGRIIGVSREAGEIIAAQVRRPAL